MDRRSTLAVMLGRKSTAKKTVSYAPPVLAGLQPYSGTWDWAQAAHLLRRTTFGPTFSQIKQSVADGLEASVSQLLASQDLPDPPIYYDFENDPNVPNGQTWVDTPPNGTIAGLNGARRRSLNAWMFGLMNESGVSIREKMTLFWHNHFVTANINRNQYRYHYIDILRRHSLGNFRTMAEEITVSPAMLLYLNGHQNSLRAPNENYSRELLELFTIGKGDAVGPGDYTNYTEDDVVQLAKALTGWRAVTRDTGDIGGIFVPNRHDVGDKQLSHRFDNVVIANQGDQEYKSVIDLILQKEETARHLARRLHIWFVGSNIDSDVELNVIEPMGALIRDNNYELKPAMEALLKSEYFYQESLKGCMVNHPIDFLFKISNTLELQMPDELILKYNGWNILFRVAEIFEMVIFAHPSVAGWKAFYQSPSFYDVWANSVSLPYREYYVDRFVEGFNFRRFRYELDLLAVIAKLDNPYDPNELINDLAKTFFPFPISQGQLDFLKEVLIPGLPDFEWTVEYSDYVANPDDRDLRSGVVAKLEALFKTMLKMPEFYLI